MTSSSTGVGAMTWIYVGWSVGLALLLWPWGRRARPPSQEPPSGMTLRVGVPDRVPWRRGRRTRDRNDPLEVLEVQIRLAQLAGEIQWLEHDRGVYARSHHLRATLGAYDAVLREACVLAGLSVADAPPVGTQEDSSERMRRELELTARGWSW